MLFPMPRTEAYNILADLVRHRGGDLHRNGGGDIWYIEDNIRDGFEIWVEASRGEPYESEETRGMTGRICWFRVVSKP